MHAHDGQAVYAPGCESDIAIFRNGKLVSVAVMEGAKRPTVNDDRLYINEVIV